MNAKSIRRTILAAIAIVAVGGSLAQAALTITPFGGTDMANELRSKSKTDWAETNNSSLKVTTSIGDFVRNNSSDDMDPFLTFMDRNTQLTVEELFTCAGFNNELHIKSGNTLLLSSKPDAKSESVIVRSDAPPEALDLVFLTNAGGPPAPQQAGDVFLNSPTNLRTYILQTGNTTHFIWALEDIHPEHPSNDWDYNDYLVYATISAVPEPSTIITGIAIGFLGLTILRRRLTAKKAAV